MDYDVGVRLDAIIARQDAMAKVLENIRTKLDSLIGALSEPEKPEPKPEARAAAGPAEEEPVQPDMPKLGKKTPPGGKWEKA